MMASNLDQSIQDNATGPKKVIVDGVTAEQHSIADQIEADRYLCSKSATKTKNRGVRFNKLSAPGTV